MPFAYVTGYGRESLPRAFGAAAIVPKPFTQRQLIEGAASLLTVRGDVVDVLSERRRQ